MEEALVDQILVDWMLPDSSGFALTRSLHHSSQYRDMPVKLTEDYISGRFG